MKILYEDNHLIAVYKSAGILVQKGSPPAGGEGHDDDTLYWQVKMFIKERDKKPGNVFLGILHRLDRPVSGIILFAKTSKGAARLSEQFRNRTVKKIYHAVVKGKIKPLSGALVHHLQKNEIENKSEVVKEGDLAELCYKTLKSGRKYSLLKIELKTGRFHQIRVQLAVTGYPIVGDAKYGSKEKIDDGSILLSATEITFKTATTGELKTIKMDYPSHWNKKIRD
ncbi:MAG: hypothetical protein A2651_04145 [Candidatus Yanofskybacteria bacterium RIFCSPHIGHO2_01_FULL_42_12]|uniref:Pseudouridine synthase RsuA/RluA-like domain-containing protein n=1 Tax=Candidatus Yanofskybacteria bacterium RIFCSPLOWO2_01_FULL_42_49 TaxID=1802694 RepID=A0A1F8GB30_9BACT|nr:MAG: hypothetical protein A2651_04145 [Candidatus Yanofskybacteria bacterium RIFCSPHIGHO2_01_FULL_42_12]OGN22592.1 MAG: hypothetical protein A2918_02370 [Candidatus Yanofskybacteria bacterium RIFCSPLOWO2_01_FULL_42_49]